MVNPRLVVTKEKISTQYIREKESILLERKNLQLQLHEIKEQRNKVRKKKGGKIKIKKQDR